MNHRRPTLIAVLLSICTTVVKCYRSTRVPCFPSIDQKVHPITGCTSIYAWPQDSSSSSGSICEGLFTRITSSTWRSTETAEVINLHTNSTADDGELRCCSGKEAVPSTHTIGAMECSTTAYTPVRATCTLATGYCPKMRIIGGRCTGEYKQVSTTEWIKSDTGGDTFTGEGDTFDTKIDDKFLRRLENEVANSTSDLTAVDPSLSESPKYTLYWTEGHYTPNGLLRLFCSDGVERTPVTAVYECTNEYLPNGPLVSGSNTVLDPSTSDRVDLFILTHYSGTRLHKGKNFWTFKIVNASPSLHGNFVMIPFPANHVPAESDSLEIVAQLSNRNNVPVDIQIWDIQLQSFRFRIVDNNGNFPESNEDVSFMVALRGSVSDHGPPGHDADSVRSGGSSGGSLGVGDDLRFEAVNLEIDYSLAVIEVSLATPRLDDLTAATAVDNVPTVGERSHPGVAHGTLGLQSPYFPLTLCQVRQVANAGPALPSNLQYQSARIVARTRSTVEVVIDFGPNGRSTTHVHSDNDMRLSCLSVHSVPRFLNGGDYGEHDAYKRAVITQDGFRGPGWNLGLTQRSTQSYIHSVYDSPLSSSDRISFVDPVGFISLTGGTGSTSTTGTDTTSTTGTDTTSSSGTVADSRQLSDKVRILSDSHNHIEFTPSVYDRKSLPLSMEKYCSTDTTNSFVFTGTDNGTPATETDSTVAVPFRFSALVVDLPLVDNVSMGSLFTETHAEAHPHV
eukprot:Lankesteria_metandrocarpae@DN2727_c0_g1_i1.p1